MMRINEELNLCTAAIQRVYAHDSVSVLDGRALRVAFVLSRLMDCSLVYPELLDQQGMGLMTRFVSLVRNHLVESSSRLQFESVAGLDRQIEWSDLNQLASGFHAEIGLIHGAFMANFIAGIQADVIGLASRVKASDGEAAAYVVGMADLTANNFGALADVAGVDMSLDTLTDFIPDGCRLAAAVRRELAH
jgi:hypothetical protein